MFNITNHQRNAKQKPQWAVTSHLLKWLSSKRQEITMWWGCGAKATLVHCLWECNLVHPLCKQCEISSKNWKYNCHMIQQFHFIQKKWKQNIKRDICLLMFIASLFKITKIWKQSKCLSMNEWIKKMWCMHRVTYSAIRKKEILPFVTMWRALRELC